MEIWASDFPKENWRVGCQKKPIMYFMNVEMCYFPHSYRDGNSQIQELLSHSTKQFFCGILVWKIFIKYLPAGELASNVISIRIGPALMRFLNDNRPQEYKYPEIYGFSKMPTSLTSLKMFFSFFLNFAWFGADFLSLYFCLLISA